LGITLALASAVVGCEPAPLTAPETSYTPVRFELNVAGAQRSVDGALVRPEFFTTAGVRPMLGRLFVSEEFKLGQPGVVVLSREYWESQFQSRPDIIGTTIVVDGRQRTIVGIAPPTFKPAKAGAVWIPKTD
jgi:hypothetical protein